MEFYNMHLNKIIKDKLNLGTDQLCASIDFYKKTTEILNLTDYNNSADLFTKLYGEESYGDNLKERIKKIINFKIDNKKLPIIFLFVNKKIYKYIYR